MNDLINDLGCLGEVNIIRDASNGTGYAVHFTISRIEKYEDEVIIYDDNGSNFSIPIRSSNIFGCGSSNTNENDHEYYIATPECTYYITVRV